MSTICAISTAKGGAIGIVRVSGKDAITFSDQIFRGRIALTSAKPYTVHFGNIVAPCTSSHEGKEDSTLPSSIEKTEEIVDEVLVTVFHAPHSYTGENSVEISCHGSSYILQRILSLLVSQGCRLAKPGEYTQRAFVNGKLDLSQAEAVADLIASQNAASHRIAMSQMRGGISQKLLGLRNELLEMTSLLELELDFSEEDVEFADREKLLRLGQEIQREIRSLADSFHTGNALKNGIPVAIIGAPNVGKSTLLNQLLQEDKAIVSDIQGTTRDTIEDTFFLSSPDGTRSALFRFIDTAGIRHTDDRIEQLGIERSMKAARQAHVILLMNEPGVPFPDIETRPEQTLIRITNKTPEFQAINGTGLPQLVNQLLNTIPAMEEDDVLITNLRHKEALDKALLDIRRSLDALNLGLSGDLIAEDLRQCLHHLAAITGGEITPDEVLCNIFKNFCIGK